MRQSSLPVALPRLRVGLPSRVNANPSSPTRKRGKYIARRGAVLAVALAVLLVVTLILGAMLQGMVHEQRQTRIRQYQWQAQWLSRAALERAQARLRAEPAYEGEAWKPTIDSRAGDVTIRVEKRGDDDLSRSVAVVARFPATDSTMSARFELSRTITLVKP